jgi:hypothetical protein
MRDQVSHPYLCLLHMETLVDWLLSSLSLISQSSFLQLVSTAYHRTRDRSAIDEDSVFNTSCDMWIVTTFRTLSAKRHIDSSAKFVCTSQPTMHPVAVKCSAMNRPTKVRTSLNNEYIWPQFLRNSEWVCDFRTRNFVPAFGLPRN